MRRKVESKEVRQVLAQKLLSLSRQHAAPARRRGFCTGLAGLDEMAPEGSFCLAAVHELLWKPPASPPQSLALLLARSAQGQACGNSQIHSQMQPPGGIIAWSDPQCELYLPAVSAWGIDLQKLLLLRCANRDDRLWAISECLRCRGIRATVAMIDRLNRIEARRLQLAAERGGGVGIFMRPQMRGAIDEYAAATRWLVEPAAGSNQVQRWKVELLHGHGGQTGKVLLLEVDRENRNWRAKPVSVRTSALLADRPAAPAPARASA